MLVGVFGLTKNGVFNSSKLSLILRRHVDSSDGEEIGRIQRIYRHYDFHYTPSRTGFHQLPFTTRRVI